MSGDFARGEVARVTNSHGKLVARGISAYSSEDWQKLLANTVKTSSLFWVMTTAQK